MWIEAHLGQPIAEAAAAARFRGADGERFAFTRVIDGHLQGVFLFGCGAGLGDSGALRKICFDAVRASQAAGSVHLVLDLREALEVPEDPAQATKLGSLVAQGLELGLYRYDRYLAEDRRDTPRLAQVTVVAKSTTPGEGSGRGQVIAAAIRRARDLVNGPAELITPSHLASVAGEIAHGLVDRGVTCTIFERDECARRGMGCYLAVARGSLEPPKFIHLAYTPAGASKGRVCLIGKGVTFDSGGYSLKSSDAMFGMKMDMAGAAAVLSALEAAARLQVPWEVHAIVAATENMIGGNAYRLGDVLRAANGKTVEIDNTDAEGRLTLADALVYAGGLRPDFTIDLATLTGACIIALGPHIAGVMSPDEGLCASWLAAGERAGESHWRLPLPPALKEQLKSTIADLRNTGDRPGGAITAGLFLSEFAGGQRWLHCDIAGPAMVKKAFGVNDEGGSGFGVATILELLSGEIG
ncbi:MAG: leucyl aminopeptidase [Nannocystaceae bacterium]